MITLDSLLHWAALLGGWTVVSLVIVSLVCIALAERQGPVEDDQFTPEGPILPKAAIKAMAARDRIERTIDLGRKRRAWARDMDLEAEIHSMIGDVKGCDHE